MRFLLCATIAIAMFAAACGKKKTRVAAPPPAPRSSPSSRIPAVPPPPVGATERGVASWYGKPYDGRQAADGEIYDMEQMVAAHRTLPFQTMVRVRNLSNNKTVDVRIIDRGPFVANRIIDLSHAAARAIDLIGPGVGSVELTIISNTAPTAPIAVSTPAAIVADDNAQFGVQVGAFRDRANADRLQKQMAAVYGSAKLVMRQELWRVLAGSEATPEAAEILATRIRKEQNLSAAFVVRLDPTPAVPN